MQPVYISLDDNELKISLRDKEGFKTISAELSSDVAKDYKILDKESYILSVKELLGKLTPMSPRKMNFYFIIEPSQFFAKFATVSKNTQDLEAQIISEVKDKFEGVSIEDLYFSYQKIAPFVYQFVALEKDLVHLYIEIANKVGASFAGLFSWVAFLPKIVNTNHPAIFIVKTGENQTVALSEFGGIFYTGVFEQAKTTQELQDLVTKLSIYKRQEPISQVFIHNYEAFSLDPTYTVSSLGIPGADDPEVAGFEMHLLVEQVLNADPGLLQSQLNLINLLPLPSVSDKKSPAIVYIGSSLAALLLVFSIFFAFRYFKNKPSQPVQLAQNTEGPVVLSQTTQESTQSSTAPAVELKREEVVFRVENGAGIAGVAARTQKFLEAKGYKVASIGNAEIQSRVTTLLKIKKSKDSLKDLIAKDIEANFELIIEDTLSEDLNYDVLLIVGSDAKL